MAGMRHIWLSLACPELEGGAIVTSWVLTIWGQLLLSLWFDFMGQLLQVVVSVLCHGWSGNSPFVYSVSLFCPSSYAVSQPLSHPESVVSNNRIHLTYKEACRFALWAGLSLEVILVSTGITLLYEQAIY